MVIPAAGDTEESLFQFKGVEYLGGKCTMKNPVIIPIAPETGHQVETKVRGGKIVVGEVDVSGIRQHYFRLLTETGYREVYEATYGPAGAMAGGDLSVYECDAIE